MASDYELGLTDIPDYPPSRIWWDPPWSLYQWPPAKPIYLASDEFYRRTFCLHLPLLGRVVIPFTRVFALRDEILAEIRRERVA